MMEEGRRIARGSRSNYSSCWPAALKTSSNEAEDGSRDSWKREKRARRMYLPTSLGLNRSSREVS